jgi:hypothetical protein
VEAATPCKQNITRSDEMPIVPTLPHPTPPTPRRLAGGAPPSFRNLGQFAAASGRKLTKVHPLIG